MELGRPVLAGYWPECGPRRSAARDRGNLRAIPTPHQHAILVLAQFRDAHGEPDADRGQRHGEGKRGKVGQHAVAEIVRFLRLALNVRQAFGFVANFLLAPAGRLCRGTRPELDDAVVVIRADGPLGFHCCWSEGVSRVLSSTGSGPLTVNVGVTST